MSESINIGVFICNCGNKISDYIDLEEVEKFAESLDNVTFVKRLPYSCSKDGKRFISKVIKEKNLTHFIVAGCSPRIFENIFRNLAEEAGLNSYLFEMVNIREQCAWVHIDSEEKALLKAKKLVGMGVAKVKESKPLDVIEEEVIPSALIIGGGITGITSAISLAEKNVKVLLVEKEKELGGMLKNLYKIYPTMINARDFIRNRIKKIESIPGIEILTNARVTSVSGCVGNYDVVITQNNREIKKNAGIIIVAAGAKALQPENPDYGKSDKVISQMDLERMLLENDKRLKNPGKVVMFQCEGVRNNERPYCARVCCITAIKNAIILKEMSPQADITILYRDIPAFNEKDRKRAELSGINFIQYNYAEPVKILEDVILFTGTETKRSGDLPYNLLILSVPVVPDEQSEELHNILGIPLDENGFLVEKQVRLKPGKYVPRGIYVAGNVHWPANTFESIAQGYSAASRGYVVLKNKKIEIEPVVVSYDSETCRGCGRCVEVCEFNAVELFDTGSGIKQVKFNSIMCKGCGVCTVVCPSGALQPQVISKKQIDSMLGVFV